MVSRNAAVLLASVIALVAGGAEDAWTQSLPLPPGTIVTGDLLGQPAPCVPPILLGPITNGAQANDYICANPASLSFVPTGPAYMVVTSVPTQYVRVFAAGGAPNRPFMADPNIIRGLTPAQIKDVLALPALPANITIVTVPAGSCVLVGLGAAIPGFGSGGPAQAWAAGTPTGPNCQGVQFLGLENYLNIQPLGAYALLYAPLAGGGNAGAVAAALDQGPYPDTFSDMDLIYKSLDLLNFGDPAALRAALQQLDGEIYADFSSVVIGAGQLFLGTVRERMRVSQGAATCPSQQWLSAFGAEGDLSGNGDSHDLNATSGGLAGGLEHCFDSTLLAGIAGGYAYTGFSTSGIPGTGSANTFALAPYGRYAPGPGYVEGALGVGYNDATITRSIVFPGQSRTATGSPRGAAFLSQVETGYRLSVDAQTEVTPFVAMQTFVIGQGAFVETGAGAANLHVDDNTTTSALSILGTEIEYALAVGMASPLRLRGRLGWAHEFAETNRTATAFFDGTPSAAAFTVTGALAPRNVAVFGLDATLATQSFDLFVGYEGAAGDGASLQGGRVGGRFTF